MAYDIITQHSQSSSWDPHVLLQGIRVLMKGTGHLMSSADSQI